MRTVPLERRVKELRVEIGRMMLTTPDSRRYSMSGGPTCGVSSAKSGRRKTVSCCGQDESYAAGVATDASVSPDWLSRQHHAALFSNANVTGLAPGKDEQ